MAKKKPYFEQVDTKVDFPSMEKKLLDKWYSKGIVDKYLAKNKKSKKRFSFLDGPITANNPMGVHHGWGRTYKDIWQRYKNMQGYAQRFQNGFDSQGLWVEVEVEKELGFKSKKDIEEYGVAKFVQKCRDRVIKYSKIQTEQSKRLGYFMDWENSYFTMSDENNYMIWSFIKVCHENGWLYKGNESVPWCPRCQTAISQHEILTEDYKEVSHDSIILEFPIKDRKREFLLVWTTTPWTIPANIAIAIDKKLDYSLVKGDTGDKYWIASKAVNRVFGSGHGGVIKTVKGEKLVGLGYKGPFDNLPEVKKVADENKDTFHTVIPTDTRIMPISTQEGTGLVHTAVSAGTQDYKLGKKLGLPMIPVIKDNADYFDGFGFLSGKNAKEHPELILDYLKKEDEKDGVDWVFDIFKYKHRYPRCWRCKEELVWKVTDEWYIAMDKGTPTLREKMKKVAKKINWIPEFGLKRELDWLDNMNDWLISKKNRYWGLCLPIWECTKCDNFEVIGSKKELEKSAVSGWEQFKGKSPHKPQLDRVKVKCSKCGKEASRIEPVGNPWLDAGIISFSTITKDNKGEPLYKKDKKEWEKWFPADFITESFPGQFKNWFYSMIAMSTVLEDRESYRIVMGYSTLLGGDGRPMHKSWGNAIDFNEGADKIGVDVMRWMYSKQSYTDNMLFGYKIADETRRRFHIKIWNIYNFFITYANSDGWHPSTKYSDKDKTNVLDKWIIARLDQTIIEVTKHLDDYRAYLAAESIESFVDDLSNWYVRRSRGRIGVNVKDSKDKNACYETLFTTLTTLTKLIAPFIPYISDAMYKNLTKSASVHLEDWPETKVLSKSANKLIKDMQILRGEVEKVHSIRKEKAIPVRQPLSLAIIINEQTTIPDDLLVLAKDELNIKRIVWKKGEKTKIDLDTKITSELKEEAKSRELIRRIQQERKRMSINLDQRVDVVSDWLPKSNELLQMIEKKTLTRDISRGNKFIVKKAS